MQDLVRAALDRLVKGLRQRGAAGVPCGGKTLWQRAQGAEARGAYRPSSLDGLRGQ